MDRLSRAPQAVVQAAYDRQKAQRDALDKSNINRPGAEPPIEENRNIAGGMTAESMKALEASLNALANIINTANGKGGEGGAGGMIGKLEIAFSPLNGQITINNGKASGKTGAVSDEEFLAMQDLIIENILRALGSSNQNLKDALYGARQPVPQSAGGQ
jgi:hypothetical protein